MLVCVFEGMEWCGRTEAACCSAEEALEKMLARREGGMGVQGCEI